MRTPHALLSVLLPVLVSLAFSGCKKNELTTLTIFHTNDFHSHLHAERNDPFALGGIARLATLLKNRRAAKAGGNTLTLDAGDWSEGSWPFSIDGGSNMLRALELLGYSATVIGNHDFLNGPNEVLRVHQQAGLQNMAVLAANFDYSQYPQAPEFQARMPGYVIRQVGNLKVGIIGLTTFQFLYNNYVTPLKITNPVDAANAISAQIRSQVDVLVVISHNNIDANLEFARQINGIDVLVSGHSHQKLVKPILVKNAGRDIPVIETGEWGKFLGEIELSIDVEKRAVFYKNYAFHPVSAEIPEDPAMKAFVDEENRKLSDKMGRDIFSTVANAEFDMWRTDEGENPIGNLSLKAYREATGADVAIEQVSLTGIGIAKGPVSLMELHNIMPHLYKHATGKEWELYLWRATGSDLLKVITVFSTVSGFFPMRSPIGWLSVENAELEWDLTGIPSRISVKKIAGEVFNPDIRYSVAITEGFLDAIRQANDLTQLGIDLSQATSTGVEAWRVIVNHAQNHPDLGLADYRVGGRIRTTTPDAAIYVGSPGTELEFAL